MIRVLMVLVLGGALFAACGGGDDDDEATDAPTSAPAEESSTPAESPTATEVEETATPTEVPVETEVEVTLTDDAIELDVDSVPAGTVVFRITNSGELGHVLMIVETDLEPDALPTTAAGAFAPGDGATIIANTPNIRGGASDAFSRDLEAGNYVLISNNVNDAIGGSNQADYASGMHTPFTVE